MRLVNVTRGNTTPQGKGKVFIAISESDKERWLEKIKNDILDQSNVAVYYFEKEADEEAVDEDEIKELIASMNFVVFPITHNFVESEYEISRDIILPFVKGRIAYSPIMLDENLLDEYNKIKEFENIQFLDPYEYYKKGDNEIAYEYKLRSRLNEIFGDDLDRENIDKAFRAQVFLSYRKIDRVEAQRLMELLHNDPECEDIAIWYDEFLVPGEDFNDSIKSAMEDSDIIALNVTGNLLEEPNYVMAEEYPSAFKQGKPILPVEMADTDKNRLKEKYEGIENNFISLDSHENVAPELRRLLEKIKGELKEKKEYSLEASEKGYYLGLAYLIGYKTEQNADRGKSYLEQSANSGLVKAMKRLANAYKNGDLGAVDTDKYLDWFNSAVKTEAENAKASMSMEDFYSFRSDVLSILDEYSNLNSDEGIQACGNLIKDVCEAFSSKYEEPIEKYTDIMSLRLEASYRAKNIDECYDLLDRYSDWAKAKDEISAFKGELNLRAEAAERMRHYEFMQSTQHCMESIEESEAESEDKGELFNFYLKMVKGLETQSAGWVGMNVHVSRSLFENRCYWWPYAQKGVELAEKILAEKPDDAGWSMNLADILYEKGWAMFLVIAPCIPDQVDDDVDTEMHSCLERAIAIYREKLSLIPDRGVRKKKIDNIIRVGAALNRMANDRDSIKGFNCFEYAVELAEAMHKEFKDRESLLYLKNVLLSASTAAHATIEITGKAIRVAGEIYDMDKSLAAEKDMADAYYSDAVTPFSNKEALLKYHLEDEDDFREKEEGYNSFKESRELYNDIYSKYDKMSISFKRRVFDMLIKSYYSSLRCAPSKDEKMQLIEEEFALLERENDKKESVIAWDWYDKYVYRYRLSIREIYEEHGGQKSLEIIEKRSDVLKKKWIDGLEEEAKGYLKGERNVPSWLRESMEKLELFRRQDAFHLLLFAELEKGCKAKNCSVIGQLTVWYEENNLNRLKGVLDGFRRLYSLEGYGDLDCFIAINEKALAAKVGNTLWQAELLREKGDKKGAIEWYKKRIEEINGLKEPSDPLSDVIRTKAIRHAKKAIKEYEDIIKELEESSNE
ncbi:MAG: toll/interleukin-1 receptor domain-containing protein [Lachnospiraceae bacterium]|nr:toll/interleukin-1 receptor domain-containing protein [Lachnospiraceae bacterium]